ncbi:SSI family serine proteinase inhibitor [Actinocorallia longicatena]|uniref:Subtilisin inhibitor domain-containing protein n=1 Tax=Actinocorallia longicatena TaxID=111803 RepID=A0ABP6Q5R6_9ACTN
MPHLAGALLGGAILSLMPFVPAAAGGPSVLRLSVTTGPITLAGGGVISSYRALILDCDPPNGHHPRAEEACAQLEASGGRIERDPGEVICTEEYAPLTVEAEGTWRGTEISFQRTYGNACEMSAATGALFDF